MKRLPSFTFALIAVFALSSCVVFERPPPEVIAAADRSVAGRDYSPPTAKNPQYYVLTTVGGLELGAVYAGEKIPPREQIEPLIVNALEKQHFRLATEKTPSPQLVIVYAWGSMNPDTLDLGNTNVPPAQLNTREMMSLVTTSKTHVVPGNIDNAVDMSVIYEGRYFILVGAYDYATFNKPAKPGGKKRTVLWRAKLSTGNIGTTLNEAIPVLLEMGADFFGADGAAATLSTRLRKGSVEIGEAKVIEEDVAKKVPPSEKSTTPPADTP